MEDTEEMVTSGKEDNLEGILDEAEEEVEHMRYFLLRIFFHPHPCGALLIMRCTLVQLLFSGISSCVFCNLGGAFCNLNSAFCT